MLIALYHSHHSLPFWHSPENPYAIYRDRILESFKFRPWDNYPTDKSHPMEPIINGLHKIDLPVLANVSLSLNYSKMVINSTKRYWVQITTLPNSFDEERVPIILEKNIVQVEHLWGGDNGTYSPLNFLPDYRSSFNEITTPEFWAIFFLQKLFEEKNKALNSLIDAQRESAKYDIIV